MSKAVSLHTAEHDLILQRIHVWQSTRSELSTELGVNPCKPGMTQTFLPEKVRWSLKNLVTICVCIYKLYNIKFDKGMLKY